jgi:hypothetical protein
MKKKKKQKKKLLKKIKKRGLNHREDLRKHGR